MILPKTLYHRFLFLFFRSTFKKFVPQNIGGTASSPEQGPTFQREGLRGFAVVACPHQQLRAMQSEKLNMECRRDDSVEAETNRK